MAQHTITLIPGDGVGPEVSEAARRVIDATGVAIRDLPLTPERVWRALQERPVR